MQAKTYFISCNTPQILYNSSIMKYYCALK
nr:MAG TPA: hypothetical protein [Caudoviricetes sp.]